MSLSNTIQGTSVSENWTASVTRSDNTNYTEKFTHSAEVPTGIPAVFRSGSRVRSWKSPTLDKSSFKAIKKSKEIKMTNYDVGKETTTDHIIQVPRAAYKYIKRGAFTTIGEPKRLLDVDVHLFDLQAQYKILGDVRSFQASTSFSPIINDDKSIEDEYNALQDVMSGTVSKLNSSYDPLTEVAELKKTIEFLMGALKSAINPLASARKVLSSLKKPSEIGSYWMQYRYAIMPIVYSIKDILETMRRSKLVYITERQMATVSRERSSRRVEKVPHLYETLTETITFRGVGKERFSENEYLRLIDNLSINPFKTAWELIPLSFVVDWFVNIGDYIEALTGSLFNFSPERKFCYSIKIKSVRSLFYRDYLDDVRTLSTGPWVSDGLTIFGKSTKVVGEVYDADYLLQTKTVDSYSRRVFIPSQVELRYDPFLNWKRYTDALVLTLGNTKRLLRGRI